MYEGPRDLALEGSEMEKRAVQPNIDQMSAKRVMSPIQPMAAALPLPRTVRPVRGQCKLTARKMPERKHRCVLHRA